LFLQGSPAPTGNSALIKLAPNASKRMLSPKQRAKKAITSSDALADPARQAEFWASARPQDWEARKLLQQVTKFKEVSGSRERCSCECSRKEHVLPNISKAEAAPSTPGCCLKSTAKPPTAENCVAACSLTSSLLLRVCCCCQQDMAATIACHLETLTNGRNTRPGLDFSGIPNHLQPFAVALLHKAGACSAYGLPVYKQPPPLQSWLMGACPEQLQQRKALLWL
jgi:hypothetical protein